MSVHLLIHFIIYNLSLLCLSLHGSLQVEVVVCVCVCEISVGYSDSRAEGLSLVTFLQLYWVAPRSTSRRPFCFCSPTRKKEREMWWCIKKENQL